MDEKPKRKRGRDPDEVHFYTALTFEECIERLERGPSHTLDYRLSVRTDGERFKVEVLGETDARRGSLNVLAEMNGYLQSWKTSHLRPGTLATRVRATISINNSLNPSWVVWLPLLWPLFVIVVMISENEFDIGMLFGLGFLPGVIFTAFFWIFHEYTAEKLNRQLPDLHQWLMDQIYDPPGVSEEE